MKEVKTVLGKGLASLLPEDSSRDRHMGISMLRVQDIRENAYQPRRDFDETAIQELAASIKASGIIQPLVVRKTATGYELIAGERRLRAAKIAGLTQVPIVIRRTTDKEALELALIENIQRQDLNCVDEARAYMQLMTEFQMTQEEVAERVGKDRSSIANHLRVLRLPEPILEDLQKGILTFGHAKVLVALESPEKKMRLRDLIITEKLSVRQAELLIQQMKEPEKPAVPTPRTPLATRLKNLALEISRQVGTKVDIQGNDTRGKFVIHYTTRADFDRILAVIKEGQS